MSLVDITGQEIPKSPYGEIKVPNVRLVGPRVLIVPKPKAEKTLDWGLVIPEIAQDDIGEGVVVLVGDGVILGNGQRIPSSVEQGDEIIYARYAGVPFEMEDTKYLMIMEQDIRMVKTYVGKVFAVVE